MAREFLCRTAVACRIVNMERSKLDDAIHRNFYTCAPSTAFTTARLYAEDDLVALFVFARLLEMSVLPRKAGAIACEVRAGIGARGFENSPRFVLVRTTVDDFVVGSETFVEDGKEVRDNIHFKGGRTLMTVDFHVQTIREIIRERIEEERRVLGLEGVDD